MSLNKDRAKSDDSLCWVLFTHWEPPVTLRSNTFLKLSTTTLARIGTVCTICIYSKWLYDCLFDTILLEVLLVRSVPCRLGISSDMALSCCLSFANLWEKFEYSNYGILPAEKLKWNLPHGFDCATLRWRALFAHTDWYTDLARGSNWSIILCL